MPNWALTLAALYRPDAEADAEDDEEFFDPSDFDDEDAARSERAAADAAETFSLATAEFCLDAAALIRAATSSALIPSIAPIPPALVLVVAALHNQDAIYLLEGDNVGRGRYPPCCGETCSC
jgi:hypothetical protein